MSNATASPKVATPAAIARNIAKWQKDKRKKQARDNAFNTTPLGERLNIKI